MTDPFQRTLTPSDDAVDSMVGDETVILHLGHGTYYGLNPIGSMIWEGLKAGQDLTEIRAAIVSEYAVSDEVAEDDMRRFISDLLDHEILVAD